MIPGLIRVLERERMTVSLKQIELVLAKEFPGAGVPLHAGNSIRLSMPISLDP